MALVCLAAVELGALCTGHNGQMLLITLVILAACVGVPIGNMLTPGSSIAADNDISSEDD